MNVLLRAALVALAGIALASCGGDDDSSAASDSRDAGADARAGYFTAEQSAELNPLLAAYDTASARYYDEHKACERTADRLFTAGRTPRESVACHFELTGGFRDSVADLHEGVESIDGDFRERCDEQTASFTAFLEEYEAAIDAVYQDWDAYASGKPTPKLQAHSDTVTEFGTRFRDEEIEAMSKACYTAADRTAAGKEG